MTDPGWVPDGDVLREYLAGRLPATEAARIDELLSRNEVPADLLRSLLVRDRVTEALRGRPAGFVPNPEDEALVAQLTARVRQMAPGRVADTPPTSAAPTRVVQQNPYSFLRPPEQPDELGRLGPYRVLGVLGAGGMGVVFRAEELRLARPVALKVIRPELAREEEARARFLREARAAAALNHDHVVPVYRVDEDDGVLYLAMPLLAGEPLEDRLAREGPLPAEEVLRIGRQIAAALAAAHQRGLIHRDVKPANVWLEAPGGRVKLLDFGLARPLAGGPQLTAADTVAGTPAYMAPEQVHGRPEPRSDLFALGCVLYRAATGQLPFPGDDTLAVLANLASYDPPAPRAVRGEVPEALSRLVVKLLAKEAHRRPQTAEQVVLEIEAIERGGVERLAPTAGEGVGRSPLSRLLPWGLALGSVFLAAVLCIVVVRIVLPDGEVREIAVPAGSTIEIVADPARGPFPTPPPPPAEWVVDDGEAGYAETGGGWKRGTMAEGFQGDYRRTDKKATQARWTFGPLAPGPYEVFVTWVQHPNRSFFVPVTIFDGPTALKTHALDQREFPLSAEAHGVGWRSLGIYTIRSGTLVVELDGSRAKSDHSKPTGAGAIADAVRVVARHRSNP